MLDVVFVGLTVAFLVAVAMIGVGLDRLSARDRNESGSAVPPGGIARSEVDR